ncbi:hypothetical protein QR680_003649 [Steinernema hermaphroditum]|uniref:RING-type domain-containing protein n=1 Tax=Steinernema hermaphroditum TaxID=289476 RepID=A0AA39HM33_9BILA|nr:hypothetical protein QR680_003649 [Steinernema hermaphroditum]
MSIFARFTCAICMSWLEDSEDIEVTNCGHIFHVGCIEAWLHRSRNEECPTCREEAVPLKRVYFSSSPFNRTEVQKELDTAYKTIEALEEKGKQLQNQVEGLCHTLEEMDEEIQELHRRIYSNRSTPNSNGHSEIEADEAEPVEDVNSHYDEIIETVSITRFLASIPSGTFDDFSDSDSVLHRDAFYRGTDLHQVQRNLAHRRDARQPSLARRLWRALCKNLHWRQSNNMLGGNELANS